MPPHPPPPAPVSAVARDVVRGVRVPVPQVPRLAVPTRRCACRRPAASAARPPSSSSSCSRPSSSCSRPPSRRCSPARRPGRPASRPARPRARNAFGARRRGRRPRPPAARGSSADLVSRRSAEGDVRVSVRIPASSRPSPSAAPRRPPTSGPRAHDRRSRRVPPQPDLRVPSRARLRRTRGGTARCLVRLPAMRAGRSALAAGCPAARLPPVGSSPAPRPRLGGVGGQASVELVGAAAAGRRDRARRR